MTTAQPLLLSWSREAKYGPFSSLRPLIYLPLFFQAYLRVRVKQMNEYYLRAKINDNNMGRYHKYMLFKACEHPTESWQLFCAFSLDLLTSLVYKAQTETLGMELLNMKERVDQKVGLFPKSMHTTKPRYRPKDGVYLGKIKINNNKIDNFLIEMNEQII